MQTYVIAASVLSADLARLGLEAEKVLAAGADFIHFDVMDNHYVQPQLRAFSLLRFARLRGSPPRLRCT